MKKETAKAIYNEVPVWMKTVLIDEFGEKTFVRKFTDIKTLEDAAEATGKSSDYIRILVLESQDEWAYRMLKMIVKAINQGWTPDWSNTNQAKYYPYFVVLPSGSGFSDSDTYYDYGDTYVGSHLCFESSEKAKYAATQFGDIYTKYLL